MGCDGDWDSGQRWKPACLICSADLPGTPLHWSHSWEAQVRGREGMVVQV